MAVKKITRKVISPSKKDFKEKEVKEKAIEVPKTEEVGKPGGASGAKRVCFFHQSKTEPTYTDIVTLRKFITDRAKIVAKAKTNLCSKHQREVCRQIKYARHLALLPFVPKV
ncbi:30S ribosomal protein S18 [Candidatus Daviesbacteria bacterium]|nr:30S ribosomal protein S18 [Candidatus Daviesbacteria bacterium]